MKLMTSIGVFATVAFLLLGAGCDCKNDKAATKTSAGVPGMAISLQNTGEGDVLAETNGQKIFFEDYKERMERQSPYIRSRYSSLDKKKEFLDNMVQFELMAAEALKRGYGENPEVIRSAKQVMVQKLMRDEFENKVKKEDISEEDLKKYYEDNKKDYKKPAMARAGHILVKVPEGADAAKKKELNKKAKDILKEVKANQKDPNAFRRLAKKHSDDESNKNRGGDLGYFASTENGGPMVKEFSDAVFKLGKVNDVSNLVETKFGWHIIRLTGKRKQIERSFADVKEQIRHRLFKDQRTQAFEKFVADLRASSKIDINEELLKSYEVVGPEKSKAPKDIPNKAKLTKPINLGNSKHKTVPAPKDGKNK